MSVLRYFLYTVVVVSLRELEEYGKALELKGADLTKFIQEQQAYQQELRAAERERTSKGSQKVWLEEGSFKGREDTIRRKGKYRKARSNIGAEIIFKMMRYRPLT